MKKYFLIICANLIPLLASQNVIADGIPCSTEYDSAFSFLTDAAIGQGNKTKLLSHLKNGWRKYQMVNRNSKRNALKELDKALLHLSSPATGQIPPALKEQIRARIQSLIDCIQSGPTPTTATLTIRTYMLSEIAENGIDGPAPAGGIIFIDGVEFGTTGQGGVATLQVQARTLAVEVRLFPSNMGRGTITLAPGQSAELSLVLGDEDISDDTALVIDQLQDGILPKTFTSLSARFVKEGSTLVPLQRVDSISLLNPTGGPDTLVTDLFALQSDGTLAVNNINNFRTLLLSRTGKLSIEVVGKGTNGLVQSSVADFFLSSFRVVGRLVAPPSNPTLNTAGIFVTGKILNTDLVFNAVSDSAGSFEFPLLPAGNLEFTSETLQNDRYYYGQGILELNRDRSLTINMLNTTDLVNGVPPFIVVDLRPGNGINPSAPEDAVDPATKNQRRADAAKTRSDFPSVIPDVVGTVSVSVVAGPQSVPQNSTATLNVPQGTTAVTLTYTVQTDEYPTYVLAQSIYNDTWSLSVRAGTAGQSLFAIGRQINSQLSTPPVWQSNGTTGQIKVSIDVAGLASAADTTLTLFASTTNVGDGILPTRVNASLGPESGVKINSIAGDSNGPLNFHSIPRSGASNTNDRFFTVKYSKPTGSTLTKVTLKLQAGSQTMTVVDAAPGTNEIQVIDNQTIKVNTAMKSIASTVNSLPPPSHPIIYTVKLFVDVGGTEQTDEKQSGERRALWKMPDGLGRYTVRIPAAAGGNEWCSKGTYSWLQTNSNLITRIGDISLEHGVGHSNNTSHVRGTEIDIFHFYTFPGAVSGTQSYNKLAADTVLAITPEGVDAKARVTAWVNASRSGMDALAANGTVKAILYAIGDSVNGLSDGWATALLKTGKTTVNGEELDLGTGTWTNGENLKFSFNSVHNNHLHITLNRVSLGEQN